VTPFGRL